MTTPEGRVKNKINKVLDKYKENGLYYYMPVPSGYGKRTLDYLGCYHGRFFAIEAKRPEKLPTSLQELTIEQIGEAGGVVFVINSDAGVGALEVWLESEAWKTMSDFQTQ